MKHIQYNNVIADKVYGCYAIKHDALGRVSYYKKAICTIGCHKGTRVWQRVIERLVPNYIKEELS